MAIIEQIPPVGSVQALTSALPRISSRVSEFAQPSVATPEGPTPGHPHPVYLLLLPDILAGRGLAAARLVSWRYLLMQGSEAVASAEVNTDSSQERHSFASVHHGYDNRAILDAVAQLEVSPVSAAGDFELRLLRIPALMTVAVWFYGASGIGLLMAIPPANSYFVQREIYTQPDWEAAMLKAASEAEALAVRTGKRPGPPPLR
jgi:hypothetical protein